MSLSNPSQLLLRNEEYLNAQCPLVVGCPDNELISHLIKLNANAQISQYQLNFAHYMASKQRYPSVLNQFSEQYQRKVEQKHDLAIIYFPKSKPEFQFILAMLTPHLAENATILIVGENKGGVKSSQKLVTNVAINAQKVDSARHCSLFSMQFNNQANSFNLDDWYKTYDINVEDTQLTIASLPGVFSSTELDHGTHLLLQHLPADMHGKVLDFGCGAGVIGAFIKTRFAKTQVEMLDVNALAIASAKKTLQLNNLTGQVYPSDGLSAVKGNYQSVVSNPPFHQGIKTNYQTTETFLKDIKKHLLKQGNLTIVANNFLRYAPIIKAELGNVEQLANRKGFAIHYCTKN